MASSAIFLGAMGVLFSFFSEEIMIYLNGNVDSITVLFLQILGSLYLGFGILNWMARPNLIGGIYSKPLAIGNLAHFGISTITLLKIIFKTETNVEILILLTITYVIFALCFGYVFMKNPARLV